MSDVEEFLVCLGLLEGEIRKPYLALRAQNPQMIPYAELWPEMLKRPGESPVKLVE